jgi:tryptophan synthase alpha chain
MTKRLQEALAKLKPMTNVGLIPYLTVGFPSVEETLALVPALERSGATIVELGIPFSDPIAEGPTIQASSYRALQQGVTTQTCMEVCKTLREQGVAIPLLFMGYYNPILSHGLAAFAKDAADAGADGAIIPDLPPEEAGELRDHLKTHDLTLITMLAPTSTEERIALACQKAEGFIYCVSVAGVTGARSSVPEGLFDYLARVRKHTSLSLAVGFGISERSHVKAIGAHAEAVVVGSKLISVIDSAPAKQRVAHASRFIAELSGREPQPT